MPRYDPTMDVLPLFFYDINASLLQGMPLILLYYIVGPFLIGAYVIKLIRKHGKIPVPDGISKIYADKPIEKKWFRVLCKDKHGYKFLDDCETHSDAVDRAYRGKEQAVREDRRAAFLVLNDKAEILEEVDS